jgi:hypothetical protein
MSEKMNGRFNHSPEGDFLIPNYFIRGQDTKGTKNKIRQKQECFKIEYLFLIFLVNLAPLAVKDFVVFKEVY